MAAGSKAWATLRRSAQNLSHFQKQRRQRWQCEFHRMRTAMRRFGVGMNSAEMARAGAAVFQGVAVQQFAPVAACGHAHAITKAGNGREVTNDENGVFGRFSFAQKRD